MTKEQFRVFIYDERIPLAIRKKVALILKGDKRISAIGLVEALQKIKITYTQRGGTRANRVSMTYNGMTSFNGIELPLLEQIAARPTISDDHPVVSRPESQNGSVTSQAPQPQVFAFGVSPDGPKFTFGIPSDLQTEDRIDIYMRISQKVEKPVLVAVPQKFTFGMPMFGQNVPHQNSLTSSANSVDHSIQPLTFHLQSTPITIVTPPFGSGGIANVYEYKIDSDIIAHQLVKIYDQPVPEKQRTKMIGDTIVCIQSLFESFSGVQACTSFASETFAEDIVRTGETNIGYRMKKLDGALDTFIMKREHLKYQPYSQGVGQHDISFFMNRIEDAKHMLNPTSMLDQIVLRISPNRHPQNYRFIHGDIKLDNILYNDQQAYLHDWDGVYVYNVHTLLHIEHTHEKGYSREMYATPTSTHPLFFLYKYFATKPDMTTDVLLGNIKKGLKNFMLYWNFTMSMAFKSQEEYKQKAIAQMKKVLPEEYMTSVSQLAEEANNEIVRQWLQAQLERLDLFSLGMSIIIKCFIMKDQSESGRITPLSDDEKIKLGTYTQIGLDVIDDALVYPSQSMQGGSMKRKTRKQKGGFSSAQVLKHNKTNIYTNKVHTPAFIRAVKSIGRLSNPSKFQGVSMVHQNKTTYQNSISNLNESKTNVTIEEYMTNLQSLSTVEKDKLMNMFFYEWLEGGSKEMHPSEIQREEVSDEEIQQLDKTIVFSFNKCNDVQYVGSISKKTDGTFLSEEAAADRDPFLQEYLKDFGQKKYLTGEYDNIDELVKEYNEYRASFTCQK